MAFCIFVAIKTKAPPKKNKSGQKRITTSKSISDKPKGSTGNIFTNFHHLFHVEHCFKIAAYQPGELESFKNQQEKNNFAPHVPGI